MRLLKNVSERTYLSIFLYLLVLISFTYSNDIIAQINRNGLPLMRNYSSDEYEAAVQNWAIVRDKRGVMYFGNNYGLLEFNGAKWEVHDNDNSAAILSLAVAEDGSIYYGSAGDFGVVIPDSIGYLDFTSLYKIYNSGDPDFNAIRGVHIIENEVIFRSSEKIFIYKTPLNMLNSSQIRERVNEILPETSFHKSFTVGNKFYVKHTAKGLMEYKNGELAFVEGSEVFANERIYFMAEYVDNKIILATRESGFYLFDSSNSVVPFTSFECNANQLIIESYLYNGVSLPNNKYALATLANGVIIINEKGEVEELINTESGIPDQAILSIYYDEESSDLWFATNENGIFKVSIGDPFREWNRINGLNGVVSDVIRFEGIVYVATSIGVFYLDEEETGFSRFKRIEGMQTESWDFELFVYGDNNSKLLVGTAAGIFEISKLKAKLAVNNGTVYSLRQSSYEPNKVLIGYDDGLGSIEYQKVKNKWKILERNLAVTYTIRSILESRNKKIYLSTEVSGIIKLNDYNDSFPLSIDSVQGLSIEGADFRVYQINKDVVIASMKGLFKYDEEENLVTPYKKLGEEFSEGDYGVLRILTNKETTWLSLYSNDLKKSKWQGVARFIKNDMDSVGADFAFSKVIPQMAALAMYDDGDNFWIANDKGLYKFDKTLRKDYEKPYNLNIFRVTTVDDSLLFAGTFYKVKDSIVYISLEQIDELKSELAFKNNQVTFEYSALFYEQEENTEYSYRLIGLNEKWSKWAKETKFPFTNLSPGDYRFEVKAKNIYGTISNVTSYEFTILPPWYLTIWAYALFGLTAVFFVWLIVRLNVRRLKKEKERLERIVEERTIEIRMKNVELEQQKEEITAQRDEIEAQRDHVVEQKDQIEVQHNMILEQTKSITDSIHYASRIQEALLPPSEVLNEVLPEHFILYRPRDIVSGDFYWATTKNNRTILVAADCTGHGVPGAFMSMLGISFLNEIINKFDHLHANQILNELKESVKRSLRQTGKDNEAKDGMDMALCILDFEKKQMEFSGAYNSLLLIRDNELIKYEADRMPVGIYVKDRGSFTNHIIDMKKGDNYYIFSDGYPDQFGGAYGSKLMIKRFKNLLLENHQMSSKQQKNALENFLNTWQSYKDEDGKKYRQLDDILVIGMKV